MLLYMWTRAIDERNTLYDIELFGQVRWCASLEKAVEEATAIIRNDLDSGVEPENVDGVGIFSVEFEPTTETIVALLEAGHILQGRIMEVQAQVKHVKTIHGTEVQPTPDCDVDTEPRF